MALGKIALFFNRAYIDTQACFTELAKQLANKGFIVHLYMPVNNNNQQPFFENQNIRIYPFPESKFEKIEFWYKIRFAKDRKYKALIGTPVDGAWLAYKVSKVQNVPYYYLADELIDHLLNSIPQHEKKQVAGKNYISNKNAAGTIALGEERYAIQKKINRIDYSHNYFVIPNAQSGEAKKLKSNYYRDIFNIEDRKPILLFAGTLNWSLANKIYEETKTYSNKEYHLIFQSRTLGLMGENDHPFIKVSTVPIPGSMMNYAVSSADIGLAIYDRSVHETRNGFTGGKIGMYLKNQLPLITGSADNLRFFEEQGVGVYWDGDTLFDEVANKAIANKEVYMKNIPGFYKENLQYEIFCEKFYNSLIASIKQD
mgnify:CR=1 FL=1